VEHNIDSSKEPKAAASQRPDLSSFRSLANETFGDGQMLNNPHAEPMPGNVTALTRMAADFFETLLADHGDSDGFLQGLIDTLDVEAVDPSKRKGGMPQSYFDELERVDKKKLKKDDECPICRSPFLDGKSPTSFDRASVDLMDCGCIRPVPVGCKTAVPCGT
jgi:hypothetical protein